MDWSLLTCARKGHVTYAPDEPRLRRSLHATTPAGDAWRCLRCGAYAYGDPHGRGPADQAPLVMRGRQLRDAFIMRLFAVERMIRALIVLAAAYGVWRFSHHRGSIQKIFQEDLPLLRPLAGKVGWDLDHSKIIMGIRHALEVKAGTLTWVAIGLLAYGVVELVEAVGLWLLKRWGEYFAVIATSLGLPIEIYELTERVTVVRVGALIVNVALIVYIVISKRLFGLRGGRAAHEAQRRSASLLEVEHASREADPRHGTAPT
ncbi:DUF2127 domain-containing protein [Actinomadura sp. HBU206391]|uniref:DUF2127 domain-containing protein n=1 Tax=Actinomadura sp. HBU206391 TaxID=2731692 RepID=UPI00164F8604|nr:DUF2127 domain-containing protein [Actinomadura sp. HBU206391]MBC6458026.1 DUF2127 domain-containing protein [Actinomadura sp. HBU206391]